jgi:23S rRNA (adenine2503-C2)-methyltransferase
LSTNKIIGHTLFGKTLVELQAIAAELGMPRFAAGQMASWLYKRGAAEIAQMTDLSQRHRDALTERYIVGHTEPSQIHISTDGTRKYLYPTHQGAAIEAALIPDGERATMCVSSQAGCRMGCAFCMTGRQGLQHNLSAGEILNQTRAAELTNIVYMGMGEPLDNMPEVLKSLEILTAPWGYAWSPTRITVSTAGVLPALREFLDATKVHLAVSLHNPFADERAAIMPIEKAWPIREVVEVLKSYDFSHQRRVSFEYIVLEGLNDTPRHVQELARLLNGLKARINLIRFHKVPGSPFASPRDVTSFRDTLTRKGIITTIRASRGEDIKAACGLLSTGAASH